MGKLAYIDGDSNLYTYPNSSQKYNNTYLTTIANFDTSGNDIQNAAFNNATIDSCQTACNNYSHCAGFTFNTDGNYCYPKTNEMYPFGGSPTYDETSTIYIRGKQPSKPPYGVSANTNNTNTINYQNYIKKGKVGSEYGLPAATFIQQQQLERLQSKMNVLSNSITNYTTKFQTGSESVSQQADKNAVGIKYYLNELKDNNIKINTMGDGNVQNILNDSDIVVLQKNYAYLFWSILAIGTVLVSMNIVKKE
jgi:hypothetical protein